MFCSSSSAVAEVFVDTARQLGRVIGERGHTLVYGGASVGMMGTLAAAARAAGARVVGVLPQAFASIAGQSLDELVMTRDLRERKAAMEARADAFVALPGGFGTLDELLEILTLRQLGAHTKPVAIVDTQGLFRPLLEQFERLYEHRFAKPEYRELCHVASEPGAAVDYIERAPPVYLPGKWFG